MRHARRVSVLLAWPVEPAHLRTKTHTLNTPAAVVVMCHAQAYIGVEGQEISSAGLGALLNMSLTGDDYKAAVIDVSVL